MKTGLRTSVAAIFLVWGCSTQVAPLPMASLKPNASSKSNVDGSASQPQTQSNTQNQTGTAPQPNETTSSLRLSWSKSTSANVGGYQIYLAPPAEGPAKLLKSVSSGTGISVPTTVDVPLKDLGTTPVAGSKVCFYIVAEDPETISPPSEEACAQF